MEDLSSMRIKDLKRICKNERIKKYSKLKKDDLVKIITVKRLEIKIQTGIKQLMEIV